jgi:hypothetical protein
MVSILIFSAVSVIAQSFYASDVSAQNAFVGLNNWEICFYDGIESLTGEALLEPSVHRAVTEIEH